MLASILLGDISPLFLLGLFGKVILNLLVGVRVMTVIGPKLHMLNAYLTLWTLINDLCLEPARVSGMDYLM
jgi:hypothetical protein